MVVDLKESGNRLVVASIQELSPKGAKPSSANSHGENVPSLNYRESWRVNLAGARRFGRRIIVRFHPRARQRRPMRDVGFDKPNSDV
jgi:hypothetical protein